MNSKKELDITVNKILSTSITCEEKMNPSWASDVLLNYMSSYDFITYDIDDQTFSIIQRPQSKDKIVSVKYSQLIGQHAMRAIYLMKSEEGYYFQALPSLNFKDDFTRKEVNHSKISVKIKEIGDFIYLSESHRILMYVEYEYPSWPPFGLISMSLVENDCALFSAQQRILNILQTKNVNTFIISYSSRLELIKMETNMHGQLRLLKTQNLRKVFSHSISLNFTKSYVCLFEPRQKKIYLYFVEEGDLVFMSSSTTLINTEIGNLTGSKLDLILWPSEEPILYQYRINEMENSIHLRSQINLTPTIQKIGAVFISESNRSCLIGSSNPEGQITNFYIFKLEMSNQLKIPDASLYLKNMKYVNKRKRVKQLSVPKIYSTVYALTGSYIHTLQKEILGGVLSFDIHPLGFFMAVSYSFNIKIYSIETQSMTLLFSFSMHNIKKVMYTSDGSNLILFSPKKIRVLNSYSFEEVFEEKQKNNNIVEVVYGQSRFMVYVLLDNGVIMERNFINFEKQNVIRLFSHSNRKILNFKVFQKFLTIFALIEDGSILVKKTDEIMGFQVKASYDDHEKISIIDVDERNSLIFLGTQSGILRIHPLGESGIFNIQRYVEKKVGYRELTAMHCCPLNNILYVGNVIGDITCISYCNSASKKNTNNRKLFPNFTSFHTLNFMLVSTTKSHTNSEKNTLESKLESLIYRMQKHIDEYHIEKEKDFEQIQKMYKIDNNYGIGAYRGCKEKIQKIQRSKVKLKANLQAEKGKILDHYEECMKKQIKENLELQKEKNQYLKQFQQEKNKLKSFFKFEENQQLQQIQRELFQMNFSLKKSKYSSSLLEEDQDMNTFQFTGMKELKESLSKQLQEEKMRCFDLNKNNGYLETAKKNMLSRKVQEETLQCRIKQELCLLSDTNFQQNNHIETLVKDLKNTEELIHKIQNQVKNTPNNVISSDKADSDLCSYKIWMKDKVQSEVSKLEGHLVKLTEKFEKKSQQVVTITMEKKAAVEKICNLKTAYTVKKEKLKKIKQKVALLQSLNINAQKNASIEMKQRNIEDKPYEFDYEKIRDIVSKQKVNEKTIYFMNKNMKIHQRKMKNFGQNNSELLCEYEKLKYENKCLADRKKEMKEEVQKLKSIVEDERKVLQGNSRFSSSRSSRHGKSTPFQRYIHNKSKKEKGLTPHFLTAVSSPRVTYQNSLRTSRKV